MTAIEGRKQPCRRSDMVFAHTTWRTAWSLTINKQQNTKQNKKIQKTKCNTTITILQQLLTEYMNEKAQQHRHILSLLIVYEEFVPHTVHYNFTRS